MSGHATRVALAVFLVGALGVWLIAPIGDACPDLGKLPAGSRSSSAPSFAPPLTRTCTYTAADGLEARQRYVPIVDWLVLALLAGVLGLGVALLRGSGPAREADAAGPPDRVPGPRKPRARPVPAPPRARPAASPRPAAPARPAAPPRPAEPARPAAPPRPAAPARPAAPEPAPVPPADGESQAAARAAQRELERQQRARRRGRS